MPNTVSHYHLNSLGTWLAAVVMDVAGLRICIQSTVDPNADTRRQAELNLKRVGALFHYPHGYIGPYTHCRQRSSPALQTRFWTFCNPNRTMGSESPVSQTREEEAEKDLTKKQLPFTSKTGSPEDGRPEMNYLHTHRSSSRTKQIFETDCYRYWRHLLLKPALNSYLCCKRSSNTISLPNGQTLST